MLTADKMRERHETVVVPIGSNGRTGRFHVPNPDGDGPICRSAGRGCKWQQRSIDVYPPRHLEWCHHCRQIVGDRLEDSEVTADA